MGYYFKEKLKDVFWGAALIIAPSAFIASIFLNGYSLIRTQGELSQKDNADNFSNDSADDIVIVSQQPPKMFYAGEHMIYIPITNDINSNDFQYEYHDGYEVIGVATNNVGDSLVVYQNVVPVACSYGENGYTNFGIPVENVKTKILK